jgi:hypothetical protein
MTQPPDKVCATCGRAFSWRRKWARDWESVRFCSLACKRGPGREGQALEQAILDALSRRRDGASICPSEVAREQFPDQWREKMEAVRRAARRLARRGAIDITQRGQRVEPDRFRGPIRLRKP